LEGSSGDDGVAASGCSVPPAEVRCHGIHLRHHRPCTARRPPSSTRCSLCICVASVVGSAGNLSDEPWPLAAFVPCLSARERIGEGRGGGDWGRREKRRHGNRSCTGETQESSFCASVQRIPQTSSPSRQPTTKRCAT
jgi:hypothetical protein